MSKFVKLKALTAGIIAALAFGAQAAPVDFVFNTGAVAGSTTNYTFTADEMTFTSLGPAVVTQTDSSAPYGLLGVADDFFEIGLSSIVNFQLNNLNVVGTGLNIGAGGYELVALFSFSGVGGFTGAVVNSTITSGSATIYYDEVQDSLVSAGAVEIGKMEVLTGLCITTAPGGAVGVPDGSCSVEFSFDASGVTAPGVWTLAPSGPDLGNLNATFTLDVDIDDITPGFSLTYPGFGSTCDPGMDGGADACFQVVNASHDGSAVVNVPEPNTIALMGMGLLGIGGFMRRFKGNFRGDLVPA